MSEQFIISENLMLAISKLNLTKTQWKVFWNIFINNYDNASKELPLTLLQELVSPKSKHAENKKPNEAARNLKGLIERKIVTKIVKGEGQYANVYAINKNVSEWRQKEGKL